MPSVRAAVGWTWPRARDVVFNFGLGTLSRENTQRRAETAQIFVEDVIRLYHSWEPSAAVLYKIARLRISGTLAIESNAYRTLVVKTLLSSNLSNLYPGPCSWLKPFDTTTYTRAPQTLVHCKCANWGHGLYLNQTSWCDVCKKMQPDAVQSKVFCSSLHTKDPFIRIRWPAMRLCKRTMRSSGLRKSGDFVWGSKICGLRVRCHDETFKFLHRHTKRHVPL